MLTIRELRAMRASMTLDAFSRQLGPFVLIQKPPDAVEAHAAMELAAKGTVLLPRKRPMDGVSLLFEFEELEIATLPPVGAVDVLSVGRLPDNDVVIDHTSVSKRHAEVRWDNGRCVVVDLNSTNGTLVNDAPVPARAELKDSDIVTFGEVRFCFLLTASLYRVMGRPAPQTQRPPTPAAHPAAAPEPPSRPPLWQGDLKTPRISPRPAATSVPPEPPPDPGPEPVTEGQGVPLVAEPRASSLPEIARQRTVSNEPTLIVPVLTPSRPVRAVEPEEEITDVRTVSGSPSRPLRSTELPTNPGTTRAKLRRKT